MTQHKEINLPKGWELTEVSSIVSESNTGLVRSAKEQFIEGAYPYVKMNNLSSSGQFDLTKIVYVDAADKDLIKGQLRNGDFVFNTRNSLELVGKCGVFNKKSDSPILFNNNLLRMRFSDVMPEIVAFWLNSPLGKQQLNSVISATTNVAAIYQKSLFRLHLPIPPLPEQKRIVEKLDSLLAQVDTIQQRLNNLPDIIKRFRQSVLAAAVSGKLTEQWRGKSNIANPEKSCLNSLGRVYGGKTPSKSNSRFWEEGSIPWVSPKDMKVYEISSSQDFITDLALTDGGMNLVPKGSILMVTRSGILAHTFPVAITMCNLTINQDIKAFTPNLDKISSEFAGILMKGLSHRVLDECSKVGTTVSSVETDKLVTLKFNLPNPQEQTEIVRLVEQYFALADTLEKNLANAKQRVDNLTQSILAKAFRGELVPQDPSDEPADKLLARIKAARLEAEKLEKAAKKAAKASKK